MYAHGVLYKTPKHPLKNLKVPQYKHISTTALMNYQINPKVWINFL